LRKAAIEKRESWTKKKLQANAKNDRSKSDFSRVKIDGSSSLLKKRDEPEKLVCEETA